jgi:hypothetical protein
VAVHPLRDLAVAGPSLDRCCARARALAGDSEAFSLGELGIDKVCELTRFATREETDRDAERTRSLTFWFENEGRVFGLCAYLPAAQGAQLVKALDRVAEHMPVNPGEEDVHLDARRADALLALTGTRIAQDADPDRATVVMHATVDALCSQDGAAEIEGGPVIHAETARRLACNARVQMVPARTSHRVVGKRRHDRPRWTIGRTSDNAFEWFHPDGVRYRAGPGPPRYMDERPPAFVAAGF